MLCLILKLALIPFFLFVCRDVYVVGVVVVFQLVAEDVSVLLEIDSLKLDPVDEGVSLKLSTSQSILG